MKTKNRKIIVLRKKLKTGEYLFICRGYRKVSADKDFPYNAGDFNQQRDFAYCCKIIDVK